MYTFEEFVGDYNNDRYEERVVRTQTGLTLSEALNAMAAWVLIHPDAWDEEPGPETVLELCEDVDDKNIQPSARICWHREEDDT